MKNNNKMGNILTEKMPCKHFLWIIRTTFILLFTCVFCSMAEIGHIQNTRVNNNKRNSTHQEVLNDLEKQTNYLFINYNDINTKDRGSVKAKQEAVSSVLNSLLLDKDIDYSMDGNHIIISVAEESESKVEDTGIELQQQKKQITGTVIDYLAEPIIGANIVEVGTTNGTVTDINGNFTLDVENNAIIRISYIGYFEQSIETIGQTSFNIILSEDTKSLDEVIVIGYGTIRKSDLTGSLSNISTEEFAEQNITRVDQVLQGRAPGVIVTNTGGAPGSDVKIRIRGANSALGSNDPLYVIDGYVGADYNMLNPNDIESIQVLKDASSTAIYGSRGSNGVVLISTKKGKSNEFRIAYNGQFSVSQPVSLYDLMNAGDFAKTANEKNRSIGFGDQFSQEEINNFYITGGTDWQKEIYRSALTQDHQINISGGNEKATYLVSFNLLDQEGIIKNSDFQRLNLRTNLTSEINDRVSFRLNTMISNSNNLNTQIRGGMGSPVVQSLAWAPTTPPFDENGNYTMFDPVGSLKANPLARLYDVENKVERFNTNVIGGLNYEFIKNIALDVQFVTDYTNLQRFNFNGNYVTEFKPDASTNSTTFITIQNTNSLTYNNVINDIHRLNIVGVFETQQFTSNFTTATARGLKFPELKYDNLAQAGAYDIASGFNKWTLTSLIGRINYSLNNKYLLTLSVRRDGSSKFKSNNRYSTFPSIALGWNLIHEEFMKKIDILSAFRVRASWGLTGSQAIQPYATFSTYNTISHPFSNDNVTSGIQLGNPGNSDLKWETTEQKNIGFELGFFDGRLSVEGDYFIKNTTDLLLNRPMPYYLGGGELTSNVGEIENKGWELAVESTIIDKKDFSWNSSFNISNVSNTVISIGGIADRIFTGSNITGIGTQSDFVYQEGKPLGSYWGLKYLGTFKPNEASEAAKYNMVPGDAKYEDLNGDYIINQSDYQIIGNGLPKTSFGWNNTINIKDLTLNIFFQGVGNVDKLNHTRGSALMADRDQRQATLEEIKTRYIPGINETSNLPAFSSTRRIITQSTMFMEDGSFIRLKNISLSYNIPNAESIIGKNRSIKLFLSATNLLTFTKYKGMDPESSSVGSDTDLNQSIDFGAYPNSKTFTIGVNINF